MSAAAESFVLIAYWVEVGLDDGAEWGVPVDAYSPEEAAKRAVDDALEHNLKPTGDAYVVENDADGDTPEYFYIEIICQHDNTEYQAYQPERHDEPGCPEGNICLDCGTFLEIDAATRLGI